MIVSKRAAAVAVAAAMPVALATSASAGVSVSHLQVLQSGAVVSSPVTVDMAAHPTGVPVTVKLDASCMPAYGNGQAYGIATNVNPASVASVSPVSVSGKHCADETTFTLVGTTDGAATVRFDPVAASPGLQKKLAGVQITINVVGTGTSGTGNPPPAHKRPAAPAVGNAYLNDKNLVAACKTAYAAAGHHWRGALIKAVARWSATNKLSTKKDNTTLYPTDNAWVKAVENKVDTLCGYTPPAV